MRRPIAVLVALLLLAAIGCNFGRSPVPAPGPVEPEMLAPTRLTVQPDQPDQPDQPAASPTLWPTQIPSPAPTDQPAEVPATELTPEDASDGTPRPTGVIYTDGGELIFLPISRPGEDITIRPTTLVSMEQVEPLQLSPDGHKVLFFHTPPDWEKELWLVSLDGTGASMLVGPEQLPSRQETDLDGEPATITRSPYQVSWLADSQQVAFNTQWNYHYGLGLADDLWLVDTHSGELRTMLAENSGGQFAFSPDGEWLLLVRPGGFSQDGQFPGEIVLARGDGSDPKTLITFPVINTASEYLFYPLTHWLPDSTQARVLIPSQDPWDPQAKAALWNISTDGTPAVELGQIPGNQLFSPWVWSADLNRIAYDVTVGDPADNQRELVLADANGANPISYQSGYQLRFEGWSSAGDSFVFSQDQPTRYLLGRSGAAAQILAEPESEIDSVMSLNWLDDDRFLYLHGNYGQWELWLGDLAGGADLLTTPAGDLPSFIPVTKNLHDR